MKVPNHIKKYIEGELIHYPANKKALAHAKQNIYLQQSASEYSELPSRSSYTSSAVEHKVIYLMSDRNIGRLEHGVATVEDILQELPEEYKRLIELKYFREHSNQHVADELSICLRTFYHWRDRAIGLFAVRMGLV